MNGVVVARYVYTPTSSSSPATSTLTYVHTSYLGTPTLETDTNGDIVQINVTDIQGNYIQRDQRNDNAYHTKSYTGHVYDDVTGLIYAHARYLDTKTHTFLSPDPLSYDIPQSYLLDPQQQNTYSYARNNSVVYTDPDGKIVWIPIILAGLYVYGLYSSYKDVKQINTNSTKTQKVITYTGAVINLSPINGEKKGAITLAKNVFTEAKPTLQLGVSLAEQMGSKSFKNFTSLKASVKDHFTLPEGIKIDFHHIVEQNPMNKVNFAESLLQSTKNIVPIERSEHSKISGFYSSIQKNSSELGFLRFRDYVSSLGFRDQFEIGVQKMEELLK